MSSKQQVQATVGWVVSWIASHLVVRCRVCRESWPPWDPQVTGGRDGMCCVCAGFAATGRPRTARTAAAEHERVRTTIDNATGEQSPYVYSAVDINGAALTIRMDYSVATRMFTGPVVITRDAACLYSHLYIGVGDDGSPDSTTKAFTVPAGTTNVTVAQLLRNGIGTIDDARGYQITAGP